MLRVRSDLGGLPMASGSSGPLVGGRTSAEEIFPNGIAPDVRTSAGGANEPLLQPACNNIGNAYTVGTILASGPGGSATVDWFGGGGASKGKVKVTSTGVAGQATVVITITGGTGPLTVGDTMTGTVVFGALPPCPTITKVTFNEGTVTI